MQGISKKLVLTMKIGGIANIVLSPVWALLYRWIEPMEGRTVPADPFWLYSFYFCTTVFGFMYYIIAADPVRHVRVMPVALGAKMWGLAAILYAFHAGYGRLPLAGFYDLVFLLCFLELYRQARSFAQRLASARNA